MTPRSRMKTKYASRTYTATMEVMTFQLRCFMKNMNAKIMTALEIK